MSRLKERNDAVARFAREQANLESARDHVEGVLQEVCRVVGVRARVDARCKTTASFAKKLYIKRDKYEDLWSECTDKLGARLTVESLRDRDRLHEYFKGLLASGGGILRVLDIEDKEASAAANELFYPGVHVQVVVPDRLFDGGDAVECEVQIRTIAQDAWCVADHKLAYKGALEPPKETKRRLLRLSVLTEMLDQEVAAAMRELETLEQYDDAMLLQRLDEIYLALVPEPGNDALSLEVLDQVGQPIEVLGRADMAARVEVFASANQRKLQDIYSSYGPGSGFEGQPGYLLFSQPESLLILHLATEAPISLRKAVGGTELEREVGNLAAAWGIDF